MKAKIPKIAVLMATYNGAKWLQDQLDSIFASEGVAPHVFVSDDGSSDVTLDIVENQPDDMVTLLPPHKTGGAGQNFIRNLLQAPWDDYDFVAFADQDDIWLPDKLMRAIQTLSASAAHGYSSDVMGVWSDGRRQYIRKSQDQQAWDYQFESAGPGNTFVFPISEAKFLRDHLQHSDPATLTRIALHDWLFYAVFRANGKRWIIDAYAGVEYRQHDANVIGAAKGLGAIKARLDMIRSDWYRTQILTISAITGHSNAVVDYLQSPQISRIWVPLRHARKCRRRRIEAWVAAAAFMAMAFRRWS